MTIDTHKRPHQRRLTLSVATYPRRREGLPLQRNAIYDKNKLETLRVYGQNPE